MNNANLLNDANKRGCHQVLILLQISTSKNAGSQKIIVAKQCATSDYEFLNDENKSDLRVMDCDTGLCIEYLFLVFLYCQETIHSVKK